MAMEQRRYRLPPFGSSAPLVPFASFPAAITVEGQIRRPAELPHVSLIARGGLWRPLGGRQVLQARFINPVTLTQLTVGRIETLGPFPGGLVRAGMQLRLNWQFQAPGIGANPRRLRVSAGSVGHAYSDDITFIYVSTTTSAAAYSGWADSYLNVLSDGNAAHYGPHLQYLGALGALSNGHITAATNGCAPVVDFSQAWDLALWGTSAAETAVTITGATWSAGVATYTTSANHTLAVGDKDVVSGITPSGWNGTFIVSAVPDSTHFSVPMAADPGAYTSGGSSSRISPMTSKSCELALVG